MSKHTPGPWEARTCYTKGEPCEYAIEGKHPEHRGPIATAHITVDNDEQDEANARLIAAAPELLSLIECGLRLFGGHMGGENDAVTGIEINQRLNLLDRYKEALDNLAR